MKEYPYMKNAIVFLYNYFARLLRNLSPLHTDLARSSVLYLCFYLARKRGWLRHLLYGQIAVDRRFSAAVYVTLEIFDFASGTYAELDRRIL